MIRKFYYSHPDSSLGGYSNHVGKWPEIVTNQRYHGVSSGEIVIIDKLRDDKVDYTIYKNGLVLSTGSTSLIDAQTSILMGAWTLKSDIRKPQTFVEILDDVIPKKRDMKEKQIVDGILAAIKITNGNLINMERKLKYRRKRFASVDNMLLQSESLSIFKGNIIRIFKQIYNSHDINRIKKAISFVLDLDDNHPLVSDVRVAWLDNIEFMSNEMTHIKQEISNAFASITVDQIQEQSIAAMVEYTSEETSTPISTALTFKDINFENIQKVKFA